MKIGIIGINHKSAELSLREQVATASQRLFPLRDSVLLSTCNRTEIYFCADDLSSYHSYLLTRLKQEIPGSFEHKLYSYFGQQCFHHLALVTSGLDSQILAETEIQKQVKTAYENGALHQELSSDLHYLFQKCLKIGKQIRTQFPISRQVPTMESVILELTNLVFKNTSKISLLLIGNSEINRSLLHHLHSKRAFEITLSTRAPHSAYELKQKYPLEVRDWSVLSSWEQFDFIISATTQCPQLIFLDEKKTIRNQLLLDLGVPRNVDPNLVKHPMINLLNIDEVASVVDKRRRHHLRDLERSKDAISLAVERQISLYAQKKFLTTH